MESTKKLTNFFVWSFFKQNGTKLEAKLHFFRISSFIGLEFWGFGSRGFLLRLTVAIHHYLSRVILLFSIKYV